MLSFKGQLVILQFIVDVAVMSPVDHDFHWCIKGIEPQPQESSHLRSVHMYSRVCVSMFGCFLSHYAYPKQELFLESVFWPLEIFRICANNPRTSSPCDLKDVFADVTVLFCSVQDKVLLFCLVLSLEMFQRYPLKLLVYSFPHDCLIYGASQSACLSVILVKHLS